MLTRLSCSGVWWKFGSWILFFLAKIKVCSWQKLKMQKTQEQTVKEFEWISSGVWGRRHAETCSSQHGNLLHQTYNHLPRLEKQERFNRTIHLSALCHLHGPDGVCEDIQREKDFLKRTLEKGVQRVEVSGSPDVRTLVFIHIVCESDPCRYENICKSEGRWAGGREMKLEMLERAVRRPNYCEQKYRKCCWRKELRLCRKWRSNGGVLQQSFNPKSLTGKSYSWVSAFPLNMWSDWLLRQEDAVRSTPLL